MRKIRILTPATPYRLKIQNMGIQTLFTESKKLAVLQSYEFAKLTRFRAFPKMFFTGPETGKLGRFFKIWQKLALPGPIKIQKHKISKIPLSTP